MKIPAATFRVGLLFAAITAAASAAQAKPVNDYPTEARVDYVIGCMMTNGQNHESMRKCSCSIDAIADQITYEDYVSIETLKTLGEVPGERATAMRMNNWSKDLMDRFRQVQVAADRQCF
jgi:hypothetical protein